MSGSEVSKIRNKLGSFSPDRLQIIHHFDVENEKKCLNKHSEYSYLAGQKFLKIAFSY